MPRILAVDFGERRVGLATSDATGSLATPRRTFRRKSDAEAAAAIQSFCREEEIDLVIFGLPRSPEGIESAFARRVRSFARKFAGASGLPVAFHEETLTSNEALRRLPPGAEREEVDRTAAAVLLEDYLRDSGGGR